MSNTSRLDANQVLKDVFDKDEHALRTLVTGGTLVPESFDRIDLTYYVSGPAVNEIQTVTYYLGATQIAVLTLTYDGTAKLTSVVRT